MELIKEWILNQLDRQWLLQACLYKQHLPSQHLDHSPPKGLTLGSFSSSPSPGLHCETDVNECQSSPCLNNAVCEDQVGRFLCKCPAGFWGTRCEKNMDECLSQPCKNGATCQDGVNSFRYKTKSGCFYYFSLLNC